MCRRSGGHAPSPHLTILPLYPKRWLQLSIDNAQCSLFTNCSCVRPLHSANCSHTQQAYQPSSQFVLRSPASIHRLVQAVPEVPLTYSGMEEESSGNVINICHLQIRAKWKISKSLQRHLMIISTDHQSIYFLYFSLSLITTPDYFKS